MLGCLQWQMRLFPWDATRLLSSAPHHCLSQSQLFFFCLFYHTKFSFQLSRQTQCIHVSSNIMIITPVNTLTEWFYLHEDHSKQNQIIRAGLPIHHSNYPGLYMIVFTSLGLLKIQPLNDLSVVQNVSDCPNYKLAVSANVSVSLSFGFHSMLNWHFSHPKTESSGNDDISLLRHSQGLCSNKVKKTNLCCL